MDKASIDNSNRFLRKPRPPKAKPPGTPPPHSSDILHAGNPQYAYYPSSYHNEYGFESPTDPMSPPPPTELQSRPHSHVYEVSRVPTRKTNREVPRRSREDGKYMLDPSFREQTNIGTYVEGKSLVKPYRPRGPAALPYRQPKRNPPMLHVYALLDEDDLRYYEPPAFTLQDFIIQMSEKERIPIEKVQSAVYSKHNYKKLQALLMEQCMPRNPGMATIQIELDDEAGCDSPRIPQKQLLLEMASLVKQQLSNAINVDMKSVIRPLPRFSPDHKPNGSHPHTEILLYEDNASERQATASQLVQNTELPSQDGFFQGPMRHFQGSRRSHSPFVTGEESFISATELAILDSIMSGGKALSLKANFISLLPDIEPLRKTITYLNLSFNDFRHIPVEVFDMLQLTVLKFRNNPIKDINPDIGRLRNLRTLVMSFCLLSSLPVEVFQLAFLEQLDVSYNRISYLPREIKDLQNLRELNVEGNQLPAMPAGAMKLNLLRYLRIRSNFMHPLFWKENTPYQPQRLMDMAAQVVNKLSLHKYYINLPDHILAFIRNHRECDLCQGSLYGLGLCIIRPASKMFGVKNIPFMFHCCSVGCFDILNTNNERLSEILYGTEQ